MSWNGNDLFNSTLMGGMPSGADPHQYLTTDGNGRPRWEDKLAYEDVQVELVMPNTSVSNVSGGMTSVACEHNGRVKVGDTGDFILDGVAHPYVAVTDMSPGPPGLVRLDVEGVQGYIKLVGTSNMYLYQVTLSPADSTHTISLTLNNRKVKPIDPMFLTEIGTIYYDGSSSAEERQAYADAGRTTPLTFNRGADIASRAFVLAYESGVGVIVADTPYHVIINESSKKVVCSITKRNADDTLSHGEITLTFSDTTA